MSAQAKTPLHSVVSVICDCLHDLSADDQARALEAARVTLGLRAPVAQPLVPTRDFAEPAPRLPIVQVEMMSGSPMVMNQPARRPGRALVMVGPQQSGRPLRQLSAPRVPATPGVEARGYVRTLRQFR
jgi:hypothetical protein